MTKAKTLFEKHYYALFFFLFIIAYSCVIPGELKPWRTDGLTLSYHAVDYSMGFCSRFLPGAIYNFLFNSITEEKVSLYSSALMIIFFAVLSIFLEKFMNNVSAEYRFTAIVVLLFFLTGPATFSIYVKVLGMLDVYWVFAAALFIILLSKKETYFLLFLPFLLCVLNYYVTWLCYIPFFAIITLYKISTLTSKKEKIYLWISLIFSLVIAFGLSLYLVIYEKDNLTYTLEEFNEIFNAYGINPEYYTISMYYQVQDTAYVGDIFTELFIRLKINLKMADIENKIPLFLLITPIVTFIYSFFFKQIKQCKERLKQLSYLCMILLFAGTMIISLIATTDLIRWTGHAFLPLFTSMLYVLYKEGDSAWIYIKENLGKYSLPTLLIYLLFYASVVYDPYFV